MFNRFLLALVFSVAAQSVSASVVEISASGFLVRNEVTMRASPEKVYSALMHEVSQWWNPEHTYSGDSKSLASVASRSSAAAPAALVHYRSGTAGT